MTMTVIFVRHSPLTKHYPRMRSVIRTLMRWSRNLYWTDSDWMTHSPLPTVRPQTADTMLNSTIENNIHKRKRTDEIT